MVDEIADNLMAKGRRNVASKKKRGKSRTPKACTGALELANEIHITATNAAAEELAGILQIQQVREQLQAFKA